MGNLIRNAARLANKLHQGQTRADGEAYINHPAMVANMLMLHDVFPLMDVTEDMIAAAWLHDVFEDTNWTSSLMTRDFGPLVTSYVTELTNIYTTEDYPEVKRKKRKSRETKRLADVSPEAQLIKLCDRYDNLRTIRAKGRKFSLVYCEESEALAEALSISPQLQLEIFKLTRNIRGEL